MSAVELKRGPGRPKGSRVVKNRAPVRRSMRETTASTSPEDEGQADGHENDMYEYTHKLPSRENLPIPLLQWTAKSHQSHAPPASDTSSAEDASWQVERQILLDEIEDLNNKYSAIEKELRQDKRQSDRKISDLQEILTHTRNESTRRIEEVTRASEDKIEELSMTNGRLIQRANEAKEREAELEQRIDVLLSGQPGPLAAGPSSRTNPAPSSSRPQPSASFNLVDSSAEDETASPRRWQQASGAKRTERNRREPQKRTPWSDHDTVTLLELTASHGAQYSKLEKIWTTHLPNRHPRDQKQIKDKARNLKVFYLKNNRPLPPGFDEIRIDAKGRAQIKDAGYNPDRMENDIDENGRLFNTYPDEE
ncbi:hypothetical protein INS49_009115 [Diaporthe citri]|uniref:uncharacterized protein n=1 Tax=Diaporthe citri TaxID=83186 RepID=UPI001C80A6F9|nr:uncharacterized protein INS49_009115 [Diaporthe citri]KAG6364012.1 hypothetical protein INS49_009115 [Diaporthe citri]